MIAQAIRVSMPAAELFIMLVAAFIAGFFLGRLWR